MGHLRAENANLRQGSQFLGRLLDHPRTILEPKTRMYCVFPMKMVRQMQMYCFFTSKIYGGTAPAPRRHRGGISPAPAGKDNSAPAET